MAGGVFWNSYPEEFGSSCPLVEKDNIIVMFITVLPDGAFLGDHHGDAFPLAIVNEFRKRRFLHQVVDGIRSKKTTAIVA